MAREDSVEGSRGNFVLLFLGGYLLAIAYGVSFLIPFMVGERGGDEDFAGAIISTATLGTLAFVTFSGHCADLLGLSKSVALAAFFLTLSMLGFVLSDGLGFDLLLYGFLLGVGWGVFYVLMPIVLAVIVKPEQRVRFFALLSGSLMAGIGTGPLVGRLVSFWLLPIESAFLVACLCSLMGGVLCFCAERNLRKNKDIVPQIARMSARAVGRIVRSPAVFPIVMAGLGGCIFGSLSSFQTVYAQTFGFDYALFFVGFMLASISCRLMLASYLASSGSPSFVLMSLIVLVSLILLSILMFITLTDDVLWYFVSAVVLGIGYGLTYVLIKGLAANEAPEELMPQSLLLFGLSYFLGVFGFPLVAGVLIVWGGVLAMLYSLLVLALLDVSIAVFCLWQQRRRRI